MRFQNLIILNLLILIIPFLIFLYFYIFKKYKNILSQLGDKVLIDRLIKSVDLKNKKRKLSLIFISLVIMLLALSRPQFGSKTIEAKRRGVDVVIAIDTSLSMLAEDVKPNRLEKAKQEVSRLINGLEGDRVSIVSFAGSAFTLCPLTLDKNTAKMFLSILGNDLMPVQGTAIADAINLSRKSFAQKERKYKVLILITDGEDHAGSVIESAKNAKDEGIQIFTIGIGKAEGEPIPIKDKSGMKTGYKKDEAGSVVISKIDEEVLNKIAEITGGQYYHVVNGDWGLYKIYDTIKSMDKKELQSKTITIYEEKFQYILIWAILLLILEFFISERQGSSLFRRTSWFVLLLMFLPGTVFAKSYNSANKDYNKGDYDAALMTYKTKKSNKKDADKVTYNLGNIYYKKNDFASAEKEYTSVSSKDNDVLNRISYNLGNALFKQGKLDQAFVSYKKALDVNPNDVDAKFNIEVLNQLAKQPPQQNQQKENQKKDEQKQEKRQQQGQQQQAEQKRAFLFSFVKQKH